MSVVKEKERYNSWLIGQGPWPGRHIRQQLQEAPPNMCALLPRIATKKTVRLIVIQLQVQNESRARTHTRPHSTHAHKHTHTRAHTPAHTRRAHAYYTKLFRQIARIQVDLSLG